MRGASIVPTLRVYRRFWTEWLEWVINADDSDEEMIHFFLLGEIPYGKLIKMAEGGTLRELKCSNVFHRCSNLRL